MITSQRVSALTDKVVELNRASSDQSNLAKFNRMWRVVNQNCGTDVRPKMFKAIQAEMTRRSAAKRKADAAARRAMSKKVAS